MGYLIDLNYGMTPRELLKALERGFESYGIDRPLEFIEVIHDGCDDCDSGHVTRFEIALGQGMELKIYYE